MQTRLTTVKKEVKYSLGPYNKFNETEQWIRLTEGCPNQCPYCYEPQDIKVFDMPEIVRNKVKILDMNLVCKPDALYIIDELGTKRVNNKVVRYELMCGVDYRFMTPEIAEALKNNRFGRFNRKNKWYPGVRLAWDWGMRDQYKIRKAIKMLTRAGFRSEELMVFMICNWKIPYEECCKKLDLLKVWNVLVGDCYFDNQVFPNVVPIHWTSQENKTFKAKCRKHEHLINYKIDPEIKK